MKRALLVLPLLSLLLSGCAGGSENRVAAAQPGLPLSTVWLPGDILPDAAAVHVTIVDDAGLPIHDASVAIIELALEATTDNAGWSVFSNLPPGSYTVAATKIGYNSDAKAITVGAEEIGSVVFQLDPVPIDAPYHETFGPLQGFFECRSAIRLTATESWTGQCGSVCAGAISGCVQTLGAVLGQNDNSVLRFNLSSPKLETIIGDMHWSQSSFATSTALRFALSHEGRDAAHWWCSAQGGTPLFFRYEVQGDSTCYNTGSFKEPAVPTQSETMRMYANTPFGDEQNPTYLTFEQRFEMVASVFYGARAPDQYSGFADA
jgi:hypothetical protein